MEPVEDTDGESHVAQDCPHVRAVELYLVFLVVVAPDEEGLHDVDGQVGHDEEGDCVPPSHLPLSSRRVGAAPQPVHYHRGLDENLDQHQQVAEEEIKFKG